MASTKINIAEKIGAGYGEFWRTRKPYVVCKGGKGSKKSTTAAQWIIYNMMKYSSANTLVVRNVFNTHKDSTWALLKWAAKNLNVIDDWNFTANPLEATYKPTGQKILFRGFDEPERLGSITVAEGVLCWVWMEEAFEIDNFQGFDMLDKSIRGRFADFGVWKRIMITFNPWVNNHWIKEKYFDVERDDTFTLTTDHRCNEFLSQEDHDGYERSLVDDPDRGKVIARGDWGIPGGAFFGEFRTDIHVREPFIIPSSWRRYTSTDYGLDMLATLWFAVSPQNEVFVYKELHQSDLIISEAAKKCLEVNNNDLIFMRYGPPDLWNRRQETGQSAAELFQANGWTMARSNNSREIGWLAVKELLKPYETRNEFTGDKKTTAKLQIFNNCKTLINYLPQLQRDQKNPNDVATDPHYLTHIADALRGFCVERFYPSKALQPQNESYIDHFMGKLQSQTETVYMNW
jgi:phage terminase large subunit